MSRTLLLCVLLGIFAASQALVGKTCTKDSDCHAGECCQILSEFMVVSRRQDAANSFFQNPTNGTCQTYKLEGAPCTDFEKINGFCGCEPGTTCNTYEVPIPKSLLQVRKPAPARPGFQWESTCGAA
ncbi:uncharacterized protein LOC106057363 [Biomphalaria glabrata]|uniref:Uncharacterized protein LOC106057363 n=1 Tax=Biomphalaria glabrata TaxID=6526 RepID=A0A9W3B2Y8_BIOGL|nr:uncharacterized protein LOC106057363 [Biomphalaria glabrata]